MLAAQLLEHFNNNCPSIVLIDASQVEHFGAISIEADALANSAVVCPLSDLIRIRATGKDRAKFLHNFCTNNINNLSAGNACEAFFTDVKAKILAHGWVLAGEDCHELWMLPGDEQAILKHLNRYIITEDVTIESAPANWQAFAVMGPQSIDVLASAGINTPNTATDSWTATDHGSVLVLEWAKVTLALVIVDSENSVSAWQSLTAAGAIAAGSIVFEHQRILEGFPIVGVDITGDNLAPEADRNAKAISYTKGCYLGQEPIARLDAMGHVNRQLYRATIQSTVTDEATADLPQITSASRVSATQQPVLLTLKVKSAADNQPVLAKMPDGTCVSLKLCEGHGN